MKSKNVFLISPMYIISTMFVVLFNALGLSFLAYAFYDLKFYVFIIIFSVVFLLEFLDFYIKAPYIYKRVTLTDEGIKHGKNFVKHTDIKDIRIYCGYVREKYALIKDFFRKPLAEIFVGEIICINCYFTGFGFKGSKGRIYIPKNEKTDAILRKHIEKYSSVSDEFCDKPDNPKITSTTIFLIISFCILAFIYTMLFAVTEGNLYVIFSAIIMSLSGCLFLLRNRIMLYVYKKLKKRSK